MSTLGDRIKEIRESLNLTGEEFGKKLNVTKVAVSNWENNNRKPDAEMLAKIAKLGDVTADYLLGITNEKKKKESLFSGTGGLDLTKTTENSNSYNGELIKAIYEIMEEKKVINNDTTKEDMKNFLRKIFDLYDEFKK